MTPETTERLLFYSNKSRYKGGLEIMEVYMIHEFGV